MKTFAALLLGLSLLAAQALHGGAMVPALPVPAYAIAVVAGICSLLGLFRARSAPSLLVLIFGLMAAGYLGWRCWVSEDRLLAEMDLGILLAGAVVWLTLSTCLTDSRSRSIFLVLLLAGCALQAFVGGLQVAKSEAFEPVFWASERLREFYADKFPARATGFFLNPNQLAWLMSAAALMCLSVGVWGRCPLAARIFLLYLAVTFGALLVFSGSRGGMLNLVVGLLLFVVLSCFGALIALRRGGAVILAGGLTVVAVVLVGVWFVYSSSWVAKGRLDSAFESPDIRVSFTRVGWRLFQETPVIGQGAGAYSHGSRWARLDHLPADAVYAHNDWVQLLSDYGIIGFGLVAAFVFMAWGNGACGFLDQLKERVHSGESGLSNGGAIQLGATSALGGFVVHSVLDFNLHIPANALLCAALLGMVSSTYWNKGGAITVISRVMGAVALIGVAAALTAFMWQTAPADYYWLRAENAWIAGRSKQAAEFAELGLQARPDHAGLLELRGKISLADANAGRWIDPEPGERQLNAAIEDLRQVVKLRPNDRQSRAVLAQALDVAGLSEEAGDETDVVVAMSPWTAFSFGALGDHYRAVKNNDFAEQAYFVGANLGGGEYAAFRYSEIREINRENRQ